MEYVSCNLCGSTTSRVLYPSTLHPEGNPDLSAFRCTSSGYGRHHTIVQCTRCGLIYANPRWNEEELLTRYEAVEDPLYVEEREGRVLTFRRHLRPLERLMPPGEGRRLLDVGCHVGIFVEIASEHGWDAWGVEPSHWAAVEARRRGLQVVEGTMASAGFADGFFDVITMWDVIEHVADPMAEVREAYRLLKPGGLLVIHTMDIESPFARLMGARWPWLMEMHITYFSRRTLRMLVEKAGFQVVEIRPQGRYLRLGYLATRVEAFVPWLGRGLGRLFAWLRVDGKAVPINLGDLVTLFAVKREA